MRSFAKRIFGESLLLSCGSGDTDAIVPVTGSRSWIRTLDLKIVEDWRPYYLNQQVGPSCSCWKQPVHWLFSLFDLMTRMTFCWSTCLTVSSGLQVAGYVTKFDNMTFATVRGAGHMVPYTQPERGLYLFGNFISDSAL